MPPRLVKVIPFYYHIVPLVETHGELSRRTCQFMMVFGLTLAMIMGHLDLNPKKWVELVKLEN